MRIDYENMSAEEWMDPVAREQRLRMKQNYLSQLFQPVYEQRFWNIDWLVQDLIPLSYFVMLAGRPKSGKSCLATALALSVATGLPFAGRPVRQGGVLWISAEENPEERNVHIYDNPYVDATTPLYTCYQRLRVDDQNDLSDLAHWVELVQAKLVVIDPLIACANRSLTDSWMARKTVQQLKDFAALRKITVLATHHIKRDPANYRRGQVADSAQLSATASMNIILSWSKLLLHPMGEVATKSTEGVPGKDQFLPHPMGEVSRSIGTEGAQAADKLLPSHPPVRGGSVCPQTGVGPMGEVAPTTDAGTGSPDSDLRSPTSDFANQAIQQSSNQAIRPEAPQAPAPDYSSSPCEPQPDSPPPEGEMSRSDRDRGGGSRGISEPLTINHRPLTARLVRLDCEGRGPFANRQIHLASFGPLDFRPTAEEKVPEIALDHCLANSEQQLLEILASGPKDTRAIMSEAFMPEGTVRNGITSLRRKGLVKVIRIDRHPPVYALTSYNNPNADEVDQEPDQESSQEFGQEFSRESAQELDQESAQEFAQEFEGSDRSGIQELPDGMGVAISRSAT